MRQRGRKSAAALSLVVNVNEPSVRHKPPEHMPEDQRAVWDNVLDNVPADWFQPETLPLLEQYCIHVCRAKFLAQLINEYQLKADRLAGETSRMLELMRQEHRQSRLIASLATKMRIAQQSTYDKSRRRKSKSMTASVKGMPWAQEVDDAEED